MPKCSRCGRAGDQLDALTLARDTEITRDQTHRWDLCRRCSTAVITFLKARPATAAERLKEHAPDAPPFLGLMLDEPTVRCLAAGQVNARAEVAARNTLAWDPARCVTCAPMHPQSRQPDSHAP